jgi:hypothetical protein
MNSRKGFEPLRGVIEDLKRLCDLIFIIINNIVYILNY